MNGMIGNLARGVHDFKATLFRSNNENQGVAIELKNFICDNDTSLKKRWGTQFLYEVNKESTFIPFDYDDNEHYLLEFKYSGSKSVCQLYNYASNNLLLGSLGKVFQWPEFFSSNTSPEGYEITTDEPHNPNEAFRAFNGVPSTGTGYTLGWVDQGWPNIPKERYLQIKLPSPINVTRFKYGYGGSLYVQLSGAPVSRHVWMWFIWSKVVLLGSNDGINWTALWEGVNTVPGSAPTKSECLVKEIELNTNLDFQYYRFLYSDKTTSGGGTTINRYSYYMPIAGIELHGTIAGQSPTPIDSPITVPQAQEAKWTQQWRRMVIVGPNMTPYEFTRGFAPFELNGLSLSTWGNPTLASFYQQRLLLTGFTEQPTQFNLSKSNDINEFTLNTTNTLATDPIQGKAQEQVYKPAWAYGGKNALYIGTGDGIIVIQSGSGTPVTGIQIDAHKRLSKPCADIPLAQLEGVAYFVGADEQSIYGFDYDFAVDRMTAVKINEHCEEHFSAGIKKIIPVKGSSNYLFILLKDGTMVACLVSKYIEYTSVLSDVGGKGFHSFFPIESSMKFEDVMTLKNNATGQDTVFAKVSLPNGKYALVGFMEFDDSDKSPDWEDDLREKIDGAQEKLYRFQDKNILLDAKTTKEVPTRGNITIEDIVGTYPAVKYYKAHYIEVGVGKDYGPLYFKDDSWSNSFMSRARKATGEVLPNILVGYNNGTLIVLPGQGTNQQVYMLTDKIISPQTSFTIYRWGSLYFTLNPSPSVGEAVYNNLSRFNAIGIVSAVENNKIKTVDFITGLESDWLEYNPDMTESVQVGTLRKLELVGSISGNPSSESLWVLDINIGRNIGMPVFHSDGNPYKDIYCLGFDEDTTWVGRISTGTFDVTQYTFATFPATSIEFNGISGGYRINTDSEIHDKDEIVINTDGGDIYINNLVYGPDGFLYGNVTSEQKLAFPATYSSYKIKRKIFSDLSINLGNHVVAVQGGKVSEVEYKYDNDGNIIYSETKIPFESGVTFGIPYDASGKYVNLSNIKTIDYYEKVSKVGVQSVCSWGLEVGSAQSNITKLDEFDDVRSIIPDRMLPVPSYRDAMINGNSRKNQQVWIKSTLPFYSEIGFIMYELGVK